jgi:transcriptional regulator with XRE-family HTH domain
MQLLAAYLVLMKLSDQIRALRGKTTFSRFAQKTMVNRQTLTELEDGSSVKLSTLQLIAEKCNLGQREWINLLIGWIRAEIGEPNFSLLNVSPSTLNWAVQQKSGRAVLCSKAFASLSDEDQRQILATMVRKPVLSCLPALNRAVQQQRAETKRRFSIYFEKELRAMTELTPSDLSKVIRKLKKSGLLEDATISLGRLLEHKRGEDLEQLADELVSEVIGHPARRACERRRLRPVPYV